MDATLTTDNTDFFSDATAATGRRSNRLRKLLTGLAIGTVVTLAGAGAANAVVNTSAQSGPWTSRWLSGNDCRVVVGAVRTANGAAVGGADVWCGSNHQISTAIYLYRWNGSAWNTYRGTNYTARSTSLSAQTGAVCGTNTWWFERAYVSVDGVNYGPIDSSSAASLYDPPC